MTDIEPEVEPHKLYVVVREDLPPGLRAAQAGHAIAEVAMKHPDLAWHWHRSGNYLIVLGVPDEETLVSWWLYLDIWETPRVGFREPDLDNSFTAFAAFPEPENNRVFNVLPLAYAQKKRRWFRRDP